VCHPQKLPITTATRLSTCKSGQIVNRKTLSSLVALHQQIQDNDDNDTIPESRRGRLFRRGKNVLSRVKRRILPVAASLMFCWAIRVSPVSAKPAAAPTQTYSLRPGMSQTEATGLLEGRLDIGDLKGAAPQQQEAPVAKKPSQSVYGDVQDAEDDFDLDEEDDNAFNTRRAASRADEAKAKRMQASSTVSQQFAGYHKPKTTMLYVKVGTGLFIPTFGVMFAREHVKQAKEEAYVKKGLAILRAQEAEYFNITSSTTDSEVEDELKGLKNNSTDDDEDDDDVDDEPDNKRKGPKRPRGGGDDGGSGSGDGGGSGPGKGDGEFTDEDRNRLNSLFDKS
jgi:hypothetical protein